MPEGEKKEKIKQAIKLAGDPSVIKQCREVASDYCTKACRQLGQLPDSPSRQALKDIADLVISRKR